MAAFRAWGKVYKNIETSPWGLTSCPFSAWSLWRAREQFARALVKAWEAMWPGLLCLLRLELEFVKAQFPEGGLPWGIRDGGEISPHTNLAQATGKMSGLWWFSQYWHKSEENPSCLWLLPSLSLLWVTIEGHAGSLSIWAILHVWDVPA